MNSVTFAAVFISLWWLSVAEDRPMQAVNTSSLSIKQISADVFTCDSSDKLLNTVCRVVLPKINSEFAARGLSVNSNNFLIRFEDNSGEKLVKGCSRSATLKRLHVSAKLSRSARIDVSGDSLVQPFAIRLELPVVLKAKLDVKQRYGVRILGSCSNYASDSFTLKGSLPTIADVMVGISFNPIFGTIKSGDYALVIEPRLAVIARLRNTNIKFRASGVSPFSAVLTSASGLFSTVMKSFTTLFKGGDIAKVFKEYIKTDLAHALVLGVTILPQPWENAIFDLLSLLASKSVKKRVNEYVEDLENSLKQSLRNTLKLDEEGKRMFVIKRDVVSLVNSFGVGADVLSDAQSANAECAQAAKICSSSTDFSFLYAECRPAQQKCSALKKKFKEMYKLSSVIVSKPKRAQGNRPKPAPKNPHPDLTPPPLPPNIRPSDPCPNEVRGFCSGCVGCPACLELTKKCDISSTPVRATLLY